MRKLILVALLSATVGAVLALWAKSAVFATSVSAPAATATGAVVAPLDLMQTAKDLPVEVIEQPY